MGDRADILASVCGLLSAARTDEASSLLAREYPFASVIATPRTCTASEAVLLFRRNGYLDRDSGSRLIFPGALLVLSELLPAQLPHHPNWKASATHLAYYELYPTVDHVLPVSRGGLDASENWVTTSMLRNSAKGNWTLEELGWVLRPPGRLPEWDGLEAWFLAYLASNPELKRRASIRKWLGAASSARAG